LHRPGEGDSAVSEDWFDRGTAMARFNDLDNG
jgi:hypothetical protein